jgi:hypothetical protein
LSRHLAGIIASVGGNPIVLDDDSVSDGSVSPSNAQAGYDYDSDGTTDVWDNGVASGPSWFRGAPSVGFGAGYEIRCTVDSGDAPNGFSPAVNTWHALSTNRDFRLTTSTAETLSGTWTIEIRVASGSTVASHTLTVSVTEDPF